jgi:hypothetical protein
VKRMVIAVALLALLAGLTSTAGAHRPHRPVGVKRVYRDCARDGRLDGRYSHRLLRRALRQMPADLAEYSACPRVIRHALSSADRRDVRRVYRQCSRTGRVRDGFSRRVLRRALREMPSDLADYSGCPDAIRAALRRARHEHR